MEIRKQILIGLLALSFLLALVSCSPKINFDLVEQEIKGKIDLFKASVEDYNVEGMLSFLEKGTFRLRITEDGQSYQAEKDYDQLEEELGEDEEKQLRAREDPPTGYGYKMSMVLGDVTYSNVSEMGASARVPFTIFEESLDFDPVDPTDTGTISVNMVKTEGEWLCQYMAIDFSYDRTDSSINFLRKAFGFTN